MKKIIGLSFIVLSSFIYFNNSFEVKISNCKYYDSFHKIPSVYVIDNEGDITDLSFQEVELKFSSSELNYLFFPATLDDEYYKDSSYPDSLYKSIQLTNIFNQTKNSAILIENSQGQLKFINQNLINDILYIDNIGDHSTSDDIKKGYKIKKDSSLTFKVRLRTNYLKINRSDTNVRLHYIYKPSENIMKNYIINILQSDTYIDFYSKHLHCDDCNDVLVTSNWIKLPSDDEIIKVKKTQIDTNFPSIIISNWPSKSDYEGNNLFGLMSGIKYKDTNSFELPWKFNDFKNFKILNKDLLGFPTTLLIDTTGIILKLLNWVDIESGNAFGHNASVILDIDGKYSNFKYTKQLPLAINYNDNIKQLFRRYYVRSKTDTGDYSIFQLNNIKLGPRGCEITYDNKRNKIVEVEIFDIITKEQQR